MSSMLDEKKPRALGAERCVTGDHAEGLVRRHLSELLTSGRFSPGARLPTERALTQTLGVARTAVRNVLAVLEAEGRVVRTVGSGTYVASADELSSVEDGFAVIDVSPAELMETRIVIEPQIMGLVIANATGADFNRMEECNRRMSEAASLEEFEHWDMKFHCSIADAAHNRLVSTLFRLLGRARERAHWGELRRRSSFVTCRNTAARMHATVLAALRERDTRRAQREMLKHLRFVEARLLRAIDLV